MSNDLGYLQGSPMRQERVNIATRDEALYLLQQMLGPTVGVERVTDEELRRKLPPQFKLAWME